MASFACSRKKGRRWGTEHWFLGGVLGCNLHGDPAVSVDRGTRRMREVASRELELAAKSEREHLVEFRRGSARAREAAFEALFRLHQRTVRGWILRIVRDPAAAEELTVETFWRIYRASDRFEPERGF